MQWHRISNWGVVASKKESDPHTTSDCQLHFTQHHSIDANMIQGLLANEGAMPLLRKAGEAQRGGAAEK